MAQYQHLPIYKQTYDILLRTMTATKDFPREYLVIICIDIVVPPPPVEPPPFAPLRACRLANISVIRSGIPINQCVCSE